jgi:hypothetical protein
MNLEINGQVKLKNIFDDKKTMKKIILLENIRSMQNV